MRHHLMNTEVVYIEGKGMQNYINKRCHVIYEAAFKISFIGSVYFQEQDMLYVK